MENLAGDYQNAVPNGELGILPMPGFESMAQKIDWYITKWRRDYVAKLPADDILQRYVKESYIIEARFDRFATGEGKCTITQSVRGYDMFLLCDPFNYGVQYEMFGVQVPTSPDEHFANLKRAISATCGKARRITVIMPMLYEGRQHKRSNRESLDCAMMLQELEAMGVNNFITFDAHDGRVQNAVPNVGFEDVRTTYQMVKALVRTFPDIEFDKEKLMVISPDEGGMSRSIFFANMIGVDLGMFYKRRDYSLVIKGRNPIVAHEYLGRDISGKDVIVPDDMISSGDSMIDVASKLHELGAKRIFICVTFGLFCEGLERFNAAYKAGLFTKVFTTNLIYQPQELLAQEWYCSVPLEKYMSYIIDTINHDQSLSMVLHPDERIHYLLAKTKAARNKN
ncbi:MAG: ribose-phosphate pyrophosphokinase [Oscillospiraceae bacterium]|jgi:ribose-phosphate pyrophosphokinase|nr:ribose-phosphate pyrophosphokinase [Oscillospiraceae bacterium]